MKDKRKKLIIIEIPILSNEYFVWVIWGEEKAKLKWLRFHFDDDAIDSDDWENQRGLTHTRKDYTPVINMNIKKEFYATLAHEAVHAVDFIFNEIGDNNRYELFAHCVGAVVRAVEKYKNK